MSAAPADPLAEGWMPGDIVRPAGSPQLRDLWFFAPDADDEEGCPFPWVVLFIEDDGSTHYVGDRVGRDELAPDVELIVRDGHAQPSAVPPATDSSATTPTGDR